MKNQRMTDEGQRMKNRMSAIGERYWLRKKLTDLDKHFARWIRNERSKLVFTAYCLWWRRRESNPDPKANAEGLYMLSCFSFLPNLAARETFARTE